MLRLLASALLGAGLAAVLVIVLVGDYSRMWIAIPAVTLLPIILVAVGMMPLLGGQVADSAPAVGAARQAGRLAPAGVLGLRATGVRVNDVTVYELDLLVEPADRPVYRTSLRRRIDPAEMPRFAVGSVIAVVRLGEDTPDVVIVADDPPPLRYAGDGHAVPVWERDPRARVPGLPRSIVPTGPRTRVARRGVFALVAVGAAAVVGWPYREDLLLSGRDLVTRGHDASAVRGEGRARAAVEAFRGERGGTVTEVLLYDKWTSIIAPTSPGATTYDTFDVRGPHVSGGRPATIQPEPTEEFDLDEVDWDAIAGLFATAQDALGYTDAQLRGNTQHAGVRRDPSTGTVGINVYLSTDYGSGSLDATADGTVTQIG